MKFEEKVIIDYDDCDDGEMKLLQTSPDTFRIYFISTWVDFLDIDDLDYTFDEFFNYVNNNPVLAISEEEMEEKNEDGEAVGFYSQIQIGSEGTANQDYEIYLQFTRCDGGIGFEILTHSNGTDVVAALDTAVETEKNRYFELKNKFEVQQFCDTLKLYIKLSGSC